MFGMNALNASIVSITSTVRFLPQLLKVSGSKIERQVTLVRCGAISGVLWHYIT